ncbi:MAG: SAF domain-containing protein [Pseudonocardiales bacterium]
MSRSGSGDERLHRPPLRLPRPRGGVFGALRWLVAAGLVALAGLLLAAGTPPAAVAPSAAVIVAARDLAGGVALRAHDLHVVRLPRALLPRGVLRDLAAAVGRAPAGPVRAGEPLTDLRLLGPPLLRFSGGRAAVAAPVRIADPGVVSLLRPGDRVDVIAGGETARVVASDLPVVAVPVPGADGPAEGGALVVLAAAPAVAARLVGIASTTRLALTVHGR